MTHYGTSAGFTTYISGRGLTAPSGDIDGALERATTYIDAVYEPRFVGTRVTWGGGALAWPRVDAQWPDGSAISGIPEEVERATYEAAFAELGKPGSLLPQAANGRVRRRERVEGAVEVEYAPDRTSLDPIEGTRPVLMAVEGILQGLVASRAYMPGVLVV